MVLGQLEVYIQSPKQLQSIPYTNMKIKPKWIINLRPKIIKLLKENREDFCDLMLGKHFFHLTPKA